MPIPSNTRPGPQVFEDRDQPVQAAPLGAVLGFVTEFNANTQIFNATTLLLLLALVQMKEIKDIATKHGQEIAVHTLAITAIRSDVAGLKREVAGLKGEIASLAGRGFDRPLVPPSDNSRVPPGGRIILKG